MPSVDDMHEIRLEEQDLSSADLTLDASAGESIEILARGIGSGSDGDVIEELVDETTMLNYFAHDGDEEIFHHEHVGLLHTDMMGVLREHGFTLPTLKVPPGTTYTLNNPNDNGIAAVAYRDFNDERFSRSDPGGPQSTDRPFVSVASETFTIAQNATEEINEITTSVNRGGIRDFPWSENVPQDREYDVMAIGVTEDSGNSGTVRLISVRLKSEEQDFIARSSETVREDYFGFPNTDFTREPFLFTNFGTGEPSPVTFEPEDDLAIEVGIEEQTNNSSQDAEIHAFVIARERRMR